MKQKYMLQADPRSYSNVHGTDILYSSSRKGGREEGERREQVDGKGLSRLKGGSSGKGGSM
jgi:hypothetical protein